jgi:hypothetical protein
MYRVLTEAEALAWCPGDHQDVREDIRAAYRRGEVCVGALRRDQLVAWVWLNYGCMPSIQVGRTLDSELETALAKGLESYAKARFPIFPPAS